MQNIPAQITYAVIWNLAVQLGGRTPDNVPLAESTMLQAFFATELRDLWKKEAWPELCDNIVQVTLTSTPGGANVFSKNLGLTNEMGDILGVFNLDPRIPTQPCWEKFRSDRVVEGNGQVYVRTSLQQVWVDYQLPCPDLLDPTLVGIANQAALMAATLPERFRLPLAYRGAGHLLTTEDPALAAQFAKLGDLEVARQAATVTRPWWRGEVRS